jgi:hypothetical protein
VSPHDLEGSRAALWNGCRRLHINRRWRKYADGAKEEAEESTVPPKKQRMNSQGVGRILSYIE